MKKKTILVYGALAALLVVNCTSCGGSGAYKITFYDDAQNVLETVNVNQGVVPSYSKGIPTKESTESTNYTFNRWIPEIKAATGDASYTASFDAELKKYTVTFDSDGGSEVAPVTVEWGKRISGVATPSKSDSATHSYTFAYWYDTTGSEETPFKMSTEIKQNYSLKAKWIEGLKYNTVSFNTNGGSFVPSQKVALDGKATKPDDPVHDSSLTSCYTFDGWYLSPVFQGNKFDFNTIITSNTELHAKWNESVREYNVNFYFGSSIYETKKVNYNGKVTAPTTKPTKTVEAGYGELTFKNWAFDFDEPIVGDVDIHANCDVNYIYYHYTSAKPTCTAYGCKAFYGTKDDTYSMSYPSQCYSVVEAGEVSREMITKIALNDESDERLVAFAHEFDETTGKCIYNCGTQSITRSVLDSSKISKTSAYTCPLKYGNMYQYNDYAKKIFSSYPLDGLTEIRFYVANPDANNTFILKGDINSCVGGIYGGGPETFDGVIAKKTGNNWVVKRESGKTMFTLPSWTSFTSYTVENPTTITDIFDTYSAAKTIYLSDIIVEGNI